MKNGLSVKLTSQLLATYAALPHTKTQRVESEGEEDGATQGDRGGAAGSGGERRTDRENEGIDSG